MQDRNIYFDESGDLGWQLGNKFRTGGSSRYFTLAFLIIPKAKEKLVERFVRRFNEKRGSTKEFKGASFRKGRAVRISREIKSLLERNSDIYIRTVTIEKEQVPVIAQEKGNEEALYNYLVRMGLENEIYQWDSTVIIPDKRSVPNGSQNSCIDMLKILVWFDQKANTSIDYTPRESHSDHKLQFIDWIANFTWRHHENNDSGAIEVLGESVSHVLLDLAK